MNVLITATLSSCSVVNVTHLYAKKQAPWWVSIACRNGSNTQPQDLQHERILVPHPLLLWLIVNCIKMNLHCKNWVQSPNQNIGPWNYLAQTIWLSLSALSIRKASRGREWFAWALFMLLHGIVPRAAGRMARLHHLVSFGPKLQTTWKQNGVEMPILILAARRVHIVTHVHQCMCVCMCETCKENPVKIFDLVSAGVLQPKSDYQSWN